MKIELKKINGETVGYSLVAESTEDKLILGSVRNMQFFGFSDTELSYDGVESEHGYAVKLNYIQKRFQN